MPGRKPAFEEADSEEPEQEEPVKRAAAHPNVFPEGSAKKTDKDGHSASDRNKSSVGREMEERP